MVVGLKMPTLYKCERVQTSGHRGRPAEILRRVFEKKPYKVNKFLQLGQLITSATRARHRCFTIALRIDD